MDVETMITLIVAFASLLGSIWANMVARRLEDQAKLNDLIRVEAINAGTKIMLEFADLLIAVETIVFWIKLGEVDRMVSGDSHKKIAEVASNLRRLTYSTAIFTNRDIRERLGTALAPFGSPIEISKYEMFFAELKQIHHDLARQFQDTYLITNVKVK